MRHGVVVVVAPDFQLARGLEEAAEQLLIAQLVGEEPCERVNEHFLLRLARITVVPLGLVLARPLQDRPARKLASCSTLGSCPSKAASDLIETRACTARRRHQGDHHRPAAQESEVVNSTL